MPYERPTLGALVTRFRQDIRTYWGDDDAVLRRALERMLDRIVPGLTHGLHGHLAWVVEQLFPDRSDPAQVLRWGAMLGLTLRPAVAARTPVGGFAQFATTGPTIPLGTTVQRGDGVRYLVTSATVVSGAVRVGLEAEEPGAAGNADPGTALILISPVAGVSSDGELLHAIRGGIDEETVESLRLRVLQRLRQAPRGGGRGDYVRWALEVPGVTRAWETARVLGPGTVGVQFVTDDEEGGPLPTPDKVDEVQAYIEERAPITVGRSIDGVYRGVIVSAPTAHVVDLQIAVVPNTTAVQAAITVEVEDFLRREAAPGVRIPLSRLREAISAAEGEFEHELLAPTSGIEPAPGALPIRGNVTFS